jgi:flagellar capping protein FliD
MADSSSANVLVGVAAVSFNDNDLGWCEDGVTMTISTDVADIKVEEIIGTLKRVVTDQGITVTLNMAEGTIANLANAIPQSSLNETGDTLTLGGGDYQSGKLVLVGKNPAGFDRTITLTKVNPTGDVGIPYKKGEISVVPVTFSALVGDDGTFGTIEDASEA